MQLDETLQICLLALASRYPHAVLDIDEKICGAQDLGATHWLVVDVIDLFEQTAPRLLQAPASLIVDEQKSILYLIVHSQRVPALKIHCCGRVPASRGTMRERQARMKQLLYMY